MKFLVYGSALLSFYSVSSISLDECNGKSMEGLKDPESLG